MDIAQLSYWEKINTQRELSRKSSSGGLRSWWSRPPAREIFYKICDNFFKVDPQKKVLEIGCAPGDRLLEFAGRYKYSPYGVEYTEVGIESTRSKFRSRGIPEGQCIYADALNQSFQNANKNKFDIVISFGFIEHFTNVDAAIDAHIYLLRPGGLLLIMIPNLRGIYYPLTKWLAPDLILKHNLTIMTMKSFETLFSTNEVQKLFCGRYGVLNFGVLQGRGRFKNIVARALQIGQAFFNPILRHTHSLENQITSPYFLYIGRKVSR